MPGRCYQNNFFAFQHLRKINPTIERTAGPPLDFDTVRGNSQRHQHVFHDNGNIVFSRNYDSPPRVLEENPYGLKYTDRGCVVDIIAQRHLVVPSRIPGKHDDILKPFSLLKHCDDIGPQFFERVMHKNADP